MEILSPVVQSVDDGEEFLIVDIIVMLSWGESLREISTRVEITVFIMLH